MDSHSKRTEPLASALEMVEPVFGPLSPASFFDEKAPRPFLTTGFGALYDGDCLSILPKLKDETIDTVFADPPFNLGKLYGKKSNDSLSEDAYIIWLKRWIDECIRVLKPGGSLFIYNLPKWNIIAGAHLMSAGLQFRHSIAIEMNNTLPISGRLYPSHYSLLYFSKGKPQTFRHIRTPIEKCRHCHGEVRDYGGHRSAMNPLGVNLKDIWTDIPPVRHWKFKSKKRMANALSTKILDRVVEISTEPGDVVLDPFGGSGTTFAVCEKLKRYWIGVELDFCDVIAERLQGSDIRHHKNSDLVEENLPSEVVEDASKRRKSTKRKITSPQLTLYHAAE
jgi:site-specific DNA-methyltransferase (adenine-specific)